MQEGQAHVEVERCLSCGTCIKECPQGAKSYRSDLELVRAMVSSGKRVAASLAPSFAGCFKEWEIPRLPSALRHLGFRYISETAIGAWYAAKASAEIIRREPDRPHISSSCPALVRYLELYRPSLLPYLLPVVSPMIAHARHLKKIHGARTKVVFIGPCTAKKAEAARPEYQADIAAVLTFQELSQWMKEEKIDLSSFEESSFDEEPPAVSRFFPLEGGLLKTASFSTDLLDGEFAAVSGFQEVAQLFSEVEAMAGRQVIEPLFCSRGCISGAGMLRDEQRYEQRRRVLRYAGAGIRRKKFGEQEIELQAKFTPGCLDRTLPFSEAEIQQVLAMTGKVGEQDQLNCGACGYATCRDKAIAVLSGLAEPQMCLPYMRRLAEQRTDRIIETSPNGIVILDEHLNILHMNPAFRRYFLCSEAVCGKPVSYLMDPQPFERLLSGDENLLEFTANHEKYGLVCHQILYPLREDKQFVGIFVNITSSQKKERELDELRANTLKQAQELLQHQIGMAELMARSLGESTARGEDLVEKLMRMAQGETKEPAEAKEWLKDTYTSK